MSGTVRIRDMERNDIPAVMELERAIFSEPWTEQGFQTALEQTASRFFVALVAEEADDIRDTRESIVGYCGWYAVGHEGDITNVAVEESMRRQGIGEKLLYETLASAGRQGVRRIFLEVRESNFPAICLYRKMGFRPCGVRKQYYRHPTEDALLLKKELSLC